MSAASPLFHALFPSTEIAFIDSAIAEHRTLAEGMRADVETILIHGGCDGLAQIAAALAGRHELRAVHVFSHGAPGLLQLGDTRITHENLHAHAHDLAVVRTALALDADLLLYGCDVAAGDAGAQFIHALSLATGARVAASIDTTGSASLDANWDLAARTGPISAQAALTLTGQQAFAGTLSIADENFDALGLINAGNTTQMVAGTWRFTAPGALYMAVADNNEYWMNLNNDGPTGDRAVILNYNGGSGSAAYTMGSADGSDFALVSFAIGQEPWGDPNLTIAAYRDGVQVVAPEAVNLTASDSTGNITYSMLGNNPDGWYGTLNFNSAYANIDEIRFAFSGDTDLEIDDIDISLGDVTPPVFSSAAVNGASLVMTYSDASNLDAVNVPGTGSFVVSAGGSSVSVTNVAINAAARTVTLTLASPVGNGQAVTVAYNDPTGGNDANAIQDAAGNDAATLGVTSVTNNTPDTTAPVFASAAVNGTSLVLTYTEANTLDASHAPAAGSFTVMAGGSSVSVSSVAVNAAAKTVTLTLASAVLNGQAVTVAYTDPTGGNDANAIQDASGNDAATLGATSVTNNTPDTTAPSVSGTIGVPSSATYVAGQALSFTITFDESVTVTGSDSTLALTLGSTVRNAAFASSTANSMTYSYTVQAGDADADGIAVGAIALGTTTIRDAAGNNANLALSGHVPTTTGILVDAVAPAVTGNIGVPTDGAYRAGQVLSFTVNFDENVTVTGSDSTLALTVGSTARSATFASSTATSATYTYTVQAGDMDADGIAVGAITLGTTTIRDAAGNDATLTLAGHVPSTAGILADTTAPAVTGNLGVPTNAAYSVGQNLDFAVTFDENVAVTGSDSTLALTVGSTARTANYLSSSGSTATYRYTVQAGDMDADGISIGALSLGTTTIKDAAGNDASLTLTGHLPSTAGILVDTSAPAVSGNIGVPANATYVAGQTLSFTVTFDDNVTVAGSDNTLALTIGSTARSAAFASSTANSVTYSYTVQAGDADADGIAVGAIALGTTTIRDAAGNDANLALSGHIPATTGILADAAAPAVTGNIGVPADGAYRAGQVLSFTVNFDENVTVAGSDSTLALTVGSTARSATFASSTATSATYTYTVQAGDTDADGITVGAITLGTTTIRDAAGNDAALSLSGHLPSTAGILADTTAPAVTGNISAPSNATYAVGQNLDFTVAFDENVAVTGSDSTLALTVGSTARTANYLSSTGSTVTYRYTVQAGDADTDGISIGALSLGTSTIKDVAGNNADVTLAGHLPSTAGVLVDTTAPGVSGNIGVPSNGTYVAGQTLSFTVTFDENVTVNGTDSTLGITIGSTARSASYASSTANSVTYAYTVQAGDADADGIAVGAIALGTSTIRDAVGNGATLTLGGHLPSTTGVLVDAAPPAFLSATVDGATLVMTYTEPGVLDAAHAPASSAFTVMAGGSAIAVNAVAVNGTAHTVSLTLASAVADGATVTVAYTDPTGGNDANAIQDAAGNDAASLAATNVLNNTAPPAPPVQTTTIDGVAVQTGTVTNTDGTQSQAITVPIVTATRVDQVGQNTVADIPLVKDASGTALLTTQVPVGLGLQAIGSAEPKPAANALTDLIRAIDAHTTSGSADQHALTGGGSGFLEELASTTPLLVQSIVPTTQAGGSAPGSDHLAIGGSTSAGHATVALVIDTRNLLTGSTIELNNVEFAAVIGTAKVTGGLGSQHVWGDSAAQTIFLGPDDDVLHGGGGDDIVGSAGGNDQIFGDDGNDIVFGGAGNDTIDGGADHDTVLLAGANRADYSLHVSGGRLVMTQLHGGTDGTDTVANVETMRFTSTASDTSAYGTTTRLVEALSGGQANVTTLDAMSAAVRQGASLSDIAHTLYSASATTGMSDDAFVRSLYQNALHRSADAEGYAYWTGRLAAGAQRADVALAIVNSTEKLAQAPADVDFNTTDVATLVRMYGTVFDRAPDEAGLNYWIGRHESGASMTDIADAFAGSAEFASAHGTLSDAQFIGAMYQAALHRAPVSGEQQWWVDKLASGQADRGDVLLGFADSAESVALVGVISTSIHTV